MGRSILKLAAAALLLAPAAMAAALPAAPPAAPPAKIPAEAFGALPFLRAPELSPDGKRLVATSVVEGKTSAVIVDLQLGDGRPHRVAFPDNLQLLWTRWAGNDRVLLSVMVPTAVFGLALPKSRLLVYDPATLKVERVGEKVGGLDGDNVIYVDPQGAYLLLSASRSFWEHPAVLRVDLQTMDAKQIVKPHSGVWQWYADPKGAVRAGMKIEGRRWSLLYRDSADGEFRTIAQGRGAEDQKLTEVEQLLPAVGTGQGYVIANKATGRYGVYRYDFTTDTIGEAVFEHPEVDVDAAHFSPRTGDLDSISYVDDRQRTVWLDPAMKAFQARLDKALPNSVNRIISRTASDERLIVWSSSPSDPGAYYLYDRASRELRELALPYAELAGKTLSPTEPVRYTARDGLSIPGYLTLPAGRPAKGLPLILMPHGGPFRRDSWTYDPWVQFLANRGYAVLQPNFRGSTGYGKPFVEAATGQFGRKMQDDLDDGVAWLVGRGLVDPKRVCIMGASYGGYAAMWAAVRTPDIYRCAISFAGISDVPAMLRYDRKRWVARRYYQDWRERLKGPEDLDLAPVSPINRAREIRVPLMIAHGEADGTVPVSQSKRMHEALEKAGIAHDYVTYPKEGHGFSEVKNSVDFLKRVEAFLEKHNPAG